MGSSSLNAEVNALERLQIVRGLTSSYLGSKIQVMHGPGKVFWSFQLALHKRLVDDHLGGDVRQLTPLPGLHLLSHRLEVSLHPVNPDRGAVDERERLRMFREHGSERSRDNVSEPLMFQRSSIVTCTQKGSCEATVAQVLRPAVPQLSTHTPGPFLSTVLI